MALNVVHRPTGNVADCSSRREASHLTIVWSLGLDFQGHNGGPGIAFRRNGSDGRIIGRWQWMPDGSHGAVPGIPPPLPARDVIQASIGLLAHPVQGWSCHIDPVFRIQGELGMTLGQVTENLDLGVALPSLSDN